MWLSEKRLNIIYGASGKTKETPFVRQIGRRPNLIPLVIDGSVMTVVNPRNPAQHEQDKKQFMSALHQTIDILYSITMQKRIALVFVYMSSRQRQKDFFEGLDIHRHYKSIDSFSSINLKLNNEDFQSIQTHIDRGGKLSLDDIYIHTLPSLVSAKERVNLYSRDQSSIERIINESDVNNSIYILSQDADLLTKGDKEVEKVKSEHQELLSRAERTYTEYEVEERGIMAIGPVEKAPSQTLREIFEAQGPASSEAGSSNVLERAPASSLQPVSGSDDSPSDKIKVIQWFETLWDDGPKEMVTELATLCAEKWKEFHGNEFSQFFEDDGTVNDSRRARCISLFEKYLNNKSTSLFEQYLNKKIKKWFMDKSDVESEYVEEFGNLSMQYFDSYVNKGFITIYTFFQDDRVHEIGPKILTKVTQRIPEVKKKVERQKSKRQRTT